MERAMAEAFSWMVEGNVPDAELDVSVVSMKLRRGDVGMAHTYVPFKKNSTRYISYKCTMRL